MSGMNMEIINLLKQNAFYPLINKEIDLPDKQGLYLICINKIEVLPEAMENLTYIYFEGKAVIYLGISGSRGLRKRHYNNHFHGTARVSTLRKSLGVLFGYEKVQSLKDQGTSNLKFITEHEKALTEWMLNNLIMYYYATDEDVENIETELISYFNPPLNLSKNKSEVNKEFRRKLSKLRCAL
ncbi:hypothetical protein CACET_c27110 [Clostridium aceticum]|uniref:Uncharacterized protein n=2 Tax=Clostridium aceticum TaxID=84022 RepID=A0A0D8I8I7_9CLOT|nr:hypothetical protein CACET_c27110 [Clostridium aceticum]KJF26578.1 hypothetical protein TZ02_11930 [Clostridium aceticum]